MLSPDDLSRAGEEVAAVYRQIEDSMVDALAGLLVSGETRSQRFETAMQLLSQSAVPRIHEVMERNRAHIDAATRSEVGRWLALSDSDDLSRIKAALGVELPGITVREAASVVEGVAGILSRDNLEMERGAAQAFLRHSTWAVTQVSSGAMTAHAAWREAAVNLAGEGITHVTYRDTASGRVTVTNHADVAVRRHIRSQLSQATMSRTLQVCREAGIGFVEVSSHTGARPTHAEWHGRVYSLDGDVTVDGRLYKDFWRGTGYQGKEGPYAALGDRLGGVNCRHAFGPWLPGTPRAYDPDLPHPSGLPNDEVYELTQRQRAQERRIRATKRELMVAREHAEPGDLGDSVRVAKLEKKLKRQQAGMRKLVDDANARGDARVLTRAYPRESVVGYRPGGGVTAAGENRALAARMASTAGFAGSFGAATEAAKKAYGEADDMVALFNARHGGSLEIEGKILKTLGRERSAAMFAAAEHAASFIGMNPAQIRLISSKRVAGDAVAQSEKGMGQSLIIRMKANALRGMTVDEVEQIMFHEVAHFAEYRLLSDARFALEADRLKRFQAKPGGRLAKSTASARVEKALRDAGFSAEYFPPSGKIRITGEGERTLWELPEYAWKGANEGTQDSELIAECIRFVAVHGYGRNAIADTVTRAFIERWRP